MKFAEHLSSHLTPEWRKQYINYELLKECLYKYINEKPAEQNQLSEHWEKCDEEFFEIVSEELTKINNFFSEKMAEAKRIFKSLHDDLSIYQKVVNRKDHKKGLEEVHTSVLRNASDTKNRVGSYGLSKLIKKGKQKHHTLHGLKLAFSEYYLSLILIQNYQSLNYTGFRKILKKHDKLIGNDKGSIWMNKYVESAPFNQSRDKVDELIVKVENLYTNSLEDGSRSKAMKRLRVPPFSDYGSRWILLRLGIFMGMFIMQLIVIFTLMLKQYNYFPTVCLPAVRLFRSTFLISFFVLLIGLNMYFWRKAGVNHVLIFRLDPRHHAKPFQIMEYGFFLLVIWGFAVIYFEIAPVMGVPSYTSPFALVVLLITFLFNPLPIFNRGGRKWTINIFKRLLLAPMYKVSFADFWLGDQLTSLSFVFDDLAYFICFYAKEIKWEHGLVTSADYVDFSNNYIVPNRIFNGTEISNSVCGSMWYGVQPLLQALPAMIRFLQSLRRYRDQYPRTKKLFPHIVNAGKYASILFMVLFTSLYSNYNKYTWNFVTYVIVCSISTCYCLFWDIMIDWGLCDVTGTTRRVAGRPPMKFSCSHNSLLRDELVYRYKAYYYLAISQNIIIRLRWVILIVLQGNKDIWREGLVTMTMFAEVIRRFIWNLIRLENEHLNNCGEFRAVRDIFIKPITSISKNSESYKGFSKTEENDDVDPDGKSRILVEDDGYDDDDSGLAGRSSPNDMGFISWWNKFANLDYPKNTLEQFADCVWRPIMFAVSGTIGYRALQRKCDLKV